MSICTVNGEDCCDGSGGGGGVTPGTGGAGVFLDNDTLLLYGWDQDSVDLGGYTVAVDSGPNGWDVSSGAQDEEPKIVGAFGGVTIDADGRIIDADLARWFDGTDDYMDSGVAIGVAAADALNLEGTIEAWIWRAPSGIDRGIVSVGGVGETQATNYVAYVRILASGFIELFWESGPGNNRQAIQAAGITVPVEQWTHIAVTWNQFGFNKSVRFYIDGSLQDTQSDVSGNGGQSSDIAYGSNTGGLAPFFGMIGSIHIQTTELSAPVIAGHAAQSDSRQVATADTFWLMNNLEAPAAYDYGPHGFHLAPRNNDKTLTAYDSPPIVADGGRSAFSTTSSSANGGWEAPNRSEIYTALQGSAEWTIECLALLSRVSAGQCPIFTHGGIGEAQDDNILVDAGFLADTVGAPARGSFVGWENGAGNNEDDTGTTAFDIGDETTELYFAFVKRSTGFGSSFVDVYVNGALHNTLGALDDPDGGDALDFLWRVGGSDRFLSGSIFGYVDFFRLSTVRRSAGDIAAMWNTLRGL